MNLKQENPLLKEILRNIGLIGQLGLAVAVPIVIFVMGFYYLERVTGTKGILIIIGVICGVICGILSAYRLLKGYWKQ